MASDLQTHGGRTVLRTAKKQQGNRSRWVHDLKQRGGKIIAGVALANKGARIAWGQSRFRFRVTPA